ncbi:hypothetical protein [Cohnella sp. AR92]|uniref:hypothetical protein n=1 Tax=Cohnella sp. AR92 TaxID=648716 RepID=UPI000F8C44B1|nr:hypothetical protein [Cohnella sp. AR92]RUS44946.1 hypothetical protein ELR57_22075 [Cohnella sp. AR92]
MKAVVIGSTSRLTPIVQNIKDLQNTEYMFELTANREIDVVILDHTSLQLLDLAASEYPKAKLIYVYGVRRGLGDDYDQAKETCGLKGAIFLVDRTDMQVQEEIAREVFPERFQNQRQNAVAFISCHRKSGTSKVVDAVAQQLAEKTQAHIGIVRLDPYDMSASREGMFQVYREYEAGSLTAERVREIAHQKGTIFEINGNPHLEYARTFMPNRLEQILGIIQHAFDVTLLDVSPYWDNSYTLVPLKSVQRKYLVATSKADEMQEFYAVTPHLIRQFDIDLRKTSFIVNFDGQGSETRLNISSFLNSPNIATLPYVPLNAKNSKHFKNGLGKLVDLIAADYSLPSVLQKQDKNRSLSSLLSGKTG